MANQSSSRIFHIAGISAYLPQTRAELKNLRQVEVFEAKIRGSLFHKTSR
jgi:hypothetical protein